MSLVQKLVLRLLAHLTLPGACAWYLASTVSPIHSAPRGAVDAGILAALLAFGAGGAVVLAALAAPVRRAVDSPVGEERARGALAAVQLPGRLAASLLALGLALLLGLCALLVRLGLAADLAVALGAAGAALVLFSALLGHGVAATGLAPVVAALGAPERAERGSLAGRVVACSGAVAVASALLMGSVAYARQRVDVELILVGLGLVAMATLAAWSVARTLTVPAGLLGEAARRAAAGDLSASPPAVAADELAGIGSAVEQVTLTLRRIVRQAGDAAQAVEAGARAVALHGERLRTAGPEGRDRALAVQAAVEAMHGSVVMVGKGVDALAGHLLGTASSEAEIEIEEVRGQAVELEARSGGAAGEVDRLVEAGRRAQAQLGSLDGYAGRAQKSLSAVSASLSELETSAIASQLAAAQAAEMAEQACGVVKEAVAGTEKLRAAVGDAKKRITALGHRSDDVDQILDFIAEVAGRTNLLSLNASIIATQAGEHGKAFAVVADQIGELANQISASTKSIAEIIGSVRDDVNGTARLIEGGDGLAADGVARVRKLLEALQGITAATAREHETAAAIRDAVQTHAQSTWEVSESVSSIGHSSESLGEALQTMSRSVNSVGSAARALSDMAGGVARAVEQRLGAGRRKRQGQSVEKIETMLADIRRAVENHDAAARRVQEALSQLTTASERSGAVAVELSRVASGLEERSRDLAESVGGFKT